MSEVGGKPRNGRVALLCAGLVALMTGAAFAAVPLYKLFCQVTGFDGTPRRVAEAGTEILDRTIKVSFDTNVRDLPWRFRAQERSQTLRIGQTGMAFFTVTNTSDRPITGQALYNVVPESAGAYFAKLQCFCFTEQTIQAGQTVEFPMIYQIDPEITRDFDTRRLSEITLSYTFFAQPSATPQKPPMAAAKVNASTSAQGLGEQRRAGL